jgi:hypothetical protein
MFDGNKLKPNSPPSNVYISTVLCMSDIYLYKVIYTHISWMFNIFEPKKYYYETVWTPMLFEKALLLASNVPLNCLPDVQNEFVWDPACGDGCIIDACHKFGVLNAFGADLYVPFETMDKTDFLTQGVADGTTLTIINPPFSQMKQFLIKMLEVKTKSAILMSSSAIYTQYFKEFISVQKDTCLLHVGGNYNFINAGGS